MPATTLNMRMNTLDLISRASDRLRMSRREIIVRLLMRMMRDVDAFIRVYGNVAYQRVEQTERWHCFSIRFNDDEKEYFTDLRNICKCSVSLLVAMAVERYLAEMIGEEIKGIYKNVRFRTYHIIKDLHFGIIRWQIYWGTPKSWKNPQLE